MAAPGFAYVKWDDPGVPLLYGAVGRLIALLDYLLVTLGGYAKEYTGTNLAVYRSTTGNRFYLRLDDTQATYTRLRAYRTMSAISTGANQWPNNTQAGNVNQWGVRKAYIAGTDPRRWWAIRTNRYLALVVEPVSDGVEGYGVRQPMIFGDVPSLAGSDLHNSLLVAHYGVDSGTNGFESCLDAPGGPAHSFNNIQVKAAMSGSPNGAIVSPLTAVTLPFQLNGSYAHAATIAISGRLHYGPLTVLCNNHASDGSTGGYPRARVPNLHQVWGAIPQVLTAGYATYNEEIVSIGDREFLVLPQYHSSVSPSSYISPGLMLEITDTDGAL